MTSNKDVAEAFGNGRIEGHSGNVFIEGKTIYSYGHHFPMAFRNAFRVYYVNSDKYSSTTSRHQNLVRGALRGEIIEVDTHTLKQIIDYGSYEEYIAHKV